MKNILLLMPIIFIFNGCGASDSKPDQKMLVSELYTVSPGDKIIKKTNDALVRIQHFDNSEDSTVELLKGEATIIH